MARYSKLATWGVAAVSVAFAQPVFAQSVVEEFFAKMSEEGGTFTYDVATEGSTTTWSNVVGKSPDGTSELTIEWIKEVANGDAYTITLAPTATMTFEADGEGGQFTISNDGLAYLVNRAGDNISMAYSAASVGISIAAGKELTDFTITLGSVSGSDTLRGADWESGGGQMTAGTMGFSMGIIEDSTEMEMNATYDDIGLEYEFDGLSGNMESPEELLNAVMRFAMTSGGGGGSGSFKEDDAPISFTFTGGGSNASFDMSGGEVTYEGAATEIAYSVNPTAMGLPPVDLSIAEAGFALGLPITKKDAPVPVQYLVKLLGLEVSEGLWRMIDPGQTIPRDPADLVIDLDGTARWLISPAELAEGEPDAMPIQFEDVNVNEIRLTIGGAEISANGSATVMNGGPFPMPIGKLDIAINGVNKLIERLSALGLLTPDMVLPARAMMGAYTTPVGDDQLTSSIEMTPDGRVLANGLPLQ